MKTQQIAIIAVAVVLIIAGGYFIFGRTSSPKQTAVPQVQEEVIPTINPQDLGLTFTATDDKKQVSFGIKNTKDISSLDYEISYLAQGSIPRGIIGHIDVTSGTPVAKNNIDLGTCSSGRCKYDTGITNLKLILKVTKNDGKVYQSEQALSL